MTLQALLLAAATTLTACGTSTDPLIGQAAATLKGCEFGPPDDLLADLKKAEAYIRENSVAFKGLNDAGFFQTSREAAVKSMTDEFNGDAARAQATYAYYAELPVNQDKLKLQFLGITERLARMEQVRRKSNYVALVRAQGKLNEELKAAQRANTDYLERQQASNANFYRALGSGPDKIIWKDSRGSTQTDTTFKGQVRENTLQSGKALEDRIERARQDNQQARQEASLAQQRFIDGNPNLSDVKDYMARESDAVSLKAWPELKRTLAELDRMLAAADLQRSRK
ncbi:MAG: hypothetical protein ABI574_12145 [Burkholderiales bacterium]